MLCCALERLFEYRWVVFLGGRQDICIIEVSGSGIEHAAAENGLHLFRQNRLNVISPQSKGLVFIKNLREGKPYGVGGDHVSGKNIDSQGRQDRFKPGVERDPVAAVYMNRTDRPQIKGHTVIFRNRANALKGP